MKIKETVLSIICLFCLTSLVASCGSNDNNNPVVNKKFQSTASVSTYTAGATTQLASSLQNFFTNLLGTNAKVTITAQGEEISVSIESLNGVDCVAGILCDLQYDKSKLNSVIDGVNGVDSFILVIKHDGETDLDYEYKSCYDVMGIWRHTDSEGKFGTLYVNSCEGKESEAAFTYQGVGYEGKVSFRNTRFIFKSNDGKLIITGYFADKNNDKITCDAEFNGEDVGKGIAFERRTRYNTVTYEEQFSVEDPDNEIPTLGINLDELRNQIANVILKKDVTNGRIDTNFGMALGFLLHTASRSDSIVNDHVKQYPALANTKAYIKGEVIVTYDDMKKDIYSDKKYYNVDLRRKKD